MKTTRAFPRWFLFSLLSLWPGLCISAVFTNNASIGPQQMEYENQAIIVSNCTLTIDGSHQFESVQVLDGGMITHSFDTDGSLPWILQVSSEAHVLSRTNSEQLLHFPDYSSLVVRDAINGSIFENQIDYLLTYTNGFAYIQLLPSSRIVDGSTNLVDYLTVSNFPTGFQLTIEKDLVVTKGGQITADAKGFGSGSGPGKGALRGQSGSGGGAFHGGMGGYPVGAVQFPSQMYSYGNLIRPTEKGSGGGPGSVDGVGGSGGGQVLFTVGGFARIDGRISVNGGNSPGYRSGGGSGGSVYLRAKTITGAGSILANGGDGDPGQGGGGGGGRIALEFESSLFSGTYSAIGGDGYESGGAGSVYLRDVTAPSGDVVFDNGGRPGKSAFFTSGPYNVFVRNGAILNSRASNLVSLFISDSSSADLLGLTLTISSNLVVESGGSINADGQGGAAGQGHGAGRTGYSMPYEGIGGGGGYGGNGGSANAASALGGQGYGSMTSPTEPGSGGGSRSYGWPPSTFGAGGGVVRLIVSGMLVCNGRISANGMPGASNGGGGGSGGSIWLTVGSIAGAGTISADGGLGDGFGAYAGGGGAGGRVAIEYAANFFLGRISAFGGEGFNFGGAGTVYTRTKNNSQSMVLVDNGGNVGASTLLGQGNRANLKVIQGARVVMQSGNFSDLFVGSNSVVFPPLDYVSLSLSNLVIERGGVVSADPRRVPSGGGVGRGGVSSYGSGGGGYGGFGGAGAGAPGGVAYGSVSVPREAGSSGGSYPSSGPGGGVGGGVIDITVSASAIVDGALTSNGGNATNSVDGGGAGGSILLTVGTLGGSGRIEANGGNGGTLGGGGGGGRIAVIASLNAFSGTMSAQGGEGYTRGGAGTVFTRKPGFTMGQLIVDNGGKVGTNTYWSVPAAMETIIRNGARVVPPEGQTFNRLVIQSGAWLLVSNQFLIVDGDATIEAGGGITAAGSGWKSGQGPGAGRGSSSNYAPAGGGGGYGGYGSEPGITNSTLPLGGNAYGVLYSQPALKPQEVGSGGGGYTGAGGFGGGIVNLRIAGTLSLRGVITANGNSGIAPGGGGGSGGAIALSLYTLTGDGVISADGGDGNGTGGGGGGGRVSIHYRTNLFSGRISAFGGGHGTAIGGAGTVFLKPANSPIATVIADNGGRIGTNTLLPQSTDLNDLLIRNGAKLWSANPSLSLNQLTIAAGGVLTLTPQSGPRRLDLTVMRDLSVQNGGHLSVNGLGYLFNAGPGAGRSMENTGSGAGYGGKGGSSIKVAGGIVYGRADQPYDFGSGGGRGYVSTTTGGSTGGGALHLRITGQCHVDGIISADGLYGLQDSSGGGSGGSIWIDAAALTGTGSITANGGNGEPYFGGGGGGGRIAVYAPLNVFTGIMTATGGDGYEKGQDGTIFYSARPVPFYAESHTPSRSASRAVSYVDITFNSPLLSSSVPASQSAVLTPLGTIPSGEVSLGILNTRILRMSFPTQSVEGDYIFSVNGLKNVQGTTMSESYTGAFSIVWPTISGRVTNHLGEPIPDVRLVRSSSDISVLTDTNGNYSIKVPPAGDVIITPNRQTMAFDLPSRVYSNLEASAVDQDFLGLPSPTIAGAAASQGVCLRWQGVEGMTYQAMYSTNLVDWELVDNPVLCTNSSDPITLNVVIENKPQVYFKLKTTYEPK